MKIALIGSKGGHVGELKLIFNKETLGKEDYILITESFTERGRKDKSFLNRYPTYLLEPDVLLKLNPFLYLKTMIALRKIFIKEKVELIITSGAQISIPAVIAARLCRVKSVFIDTVVNIKTFSWCARFCYFFANKFLVQHKCMTKRYGRKAEYHGGII